MMLPKLGYSFDEVIADITAELCAALRQVASEVDFGADVDRELVEESVTNRKRVI